MRVFGSGVAFHFPGLKPRAKKNEVPRGLSWAGKIAVPSVFRRSPSGTWFFVARHFSAGALERNPMSAQIEYLLTSEVARPTEFDCTVTKRLEFTYMQISFESPGGFHFGSEEIPIRTS